MTPLLDVHTHTLASGHAYSTIQEMAQRAAELNLQVLGITEHTHAMPGAPLPLYFRNLGVIPRNMYGVQLLMGAETNILGTDGKIDMEEEDLTYLDICIAGIHKLCWWPKNKEENTAALLGAIHNPWIQIISHPTDSPFLLDYHPIVAAAKETGTLLELNNSTLNPNRHKLTAYDNSCQMLQFCKQMEVPVILGSDAHISFSVADYSRVLPLLRDTNFPERLVVNDKLELFFHSLKPKPKQ